MPGKKKATGMSTRQSFLDRNVIAENNAIMRFNEDIENAARGIGPSRGSTPGGARGRTPRTTRPDRPPRAAPPPALLPQQEEALRTAIAAATQDEVVAAAGVRLVDSLVRGDRFERAGDVGWRALAEDPGTGERSPKDWDRLRSAWSAVRRAALAEWVKSHPDAAGLQEKEEKAAARSARAATKRLAARRPRRPRSAATRTQNDSLAAAMEGEPAEIDGGGQAGTEDPPPGAVPTSEEKPRRPRRRRPHRGAKPPGRPSGAADATEQEPHPPSPEPTPEPTPGPLSPDPQPAPAEEGEG